MPAPSIIYNKRLETEYATLFASCIIDTNRRQLASALVGKIQANKQRYEKVAAVIGCPWFVIGLMHQMEATLNFSKHLHNGDPLSAKTVRVPKNRPDGHAPWTWEVSAIDALQLKALHKVTDWSIPHILFLLEGFNGYGYRQYHHDVLSPYLWSMTNHYKIGKYDRDGHFNPSLVSQQMGAAAILKRAIELGVYTIQNA
jgi:lysozyme family protein